MTLETKQPVAPSQFQRRIKYGSNVAILLFAVLAIVVLVNWLAVRKAGTWPLTRIDMTSSRRYTLSEQTLKVLGSLEKPVRIATVFAGGLRLDSTTRSMIENFEDLLDEYKQRGGQQIRIDRINAADVAQVETFLNELAALYQSATTPAQQAIASGLATYGDIQQFAQDQAAYLASRIEGLKSADPQAANDAQQVMDFFANAPTTLQLDSKAAGVKDYDQGPMPDYQQASAIVREPLDAMKAVLETLNQRIVTNYKAPEHPEATRETFTALGKAIDPLLKKISDAAEAMAAIDLADYNAARTSVLGANTVIVMTDTAATTIELADVYASASPDGEQEQPQQRFRGEEAVTGSIISLNMQNPPKIVFVNPGQQPAIGGSFAHVADRLLKMHFEVEEWYPAGQQTQFGPMPPQPRPTAGPDQAIVWIFLASDRPSPAMFEAQQAMGDIIDTGQPILLHVARTAYAMPNPEDPITRLGEKFGLKIDPTQLVLTTRPDREGTPRPTSAVRSDQWNQSHTLAKALAGRSVLAGSLISLSIPSDSPAVALLHSAADTWAERDWTNQQEWPEQNNNETTGPFPIAIASEVEGQRLIVLGDHNLAANQMIVTQQLLPTEGRIELVEQLVLPGNAELFVNSIYWLAGMDELIGSGARSQDVRRIGPVSDLQRSVVSWLMLAGLPAASLAAGTVVWFIRRK